MNHISSSMVTVLGVLSLAGWTSPTPVETVLYSFLGGSDGASPFGLIAGRDDALYGTTGDGGSGTCITYDAGGLPVSGGCGTVFKLIPPASGQTAWTKSVLYNFLGGGDGEGPNALIVDRDGDGALYGTTGGGGSGACVTGGNGVPLVVSGCGTVFKLTPPIDGETAWTKKILYSFLGGSDGESPNALIADREGALFGTASTGGASGYGAVFKLTRHSKGETAWSESVLSSFTGQFNGDGDGPHGLVAGRDGALYGTTGLGGKTGNGAVFKLMPPNEGATVWTEAVLYSFCTQSNCSDGDLPNAGLILDRAGELYGTTSIGGINYPAGNGTVFKLTPPAIEHSGWTETVLYYFAGGSDGAYPLAGLSTDREGAFYGTTQAGGSSNCAGYGCGTILKLTPPVDGQAHWTETVLYRFEGGGDSARPFISPIVDSGRALYGTTSEGGSANDGTVFELSLYPGKRDRLEKEQRDRKKDQLDRDSDSIFPVSE
jgi:uncharacterized repeat protein (TIGR03803 family)